MRMPVREMYEDHTLKSLFNAIRGYREAQDQSYKTGWEQVQANIHHILSREALKLPWQNKKQPPKTQQVTEGDPKQLIEKHLKG